MKIKLKYSSKYEYEDRDKETHISERAAEEGTWRGLEALAGMTSGMVGPSLNSDATTFWGTIGGPEEREVAEEPSAEELVVEEEEDSMGGASLMMLIDTSPSGLWTLSPIWILYTISQHTYIDCHAEIAMKGARQRRRDRSKESKAYAIGSIGSSPIGNPMATLRRLSSSGRLPWLSNLRNANSF